MAIKLLNSCLDILHTQGLASQVFHSYFARVKRDLLDDDTVAAALVVAAGQFDDGSEDATVLFSLLLDEARMGLENDSAYGQAFLNNVETAIGTGLASGSFEQHHLLKFAGQYRRVGLPVPNALTINPDKVMGTGEVPPPDLEVYLEKLAAEVQAEGGGAYELFNALHEMTAAMPEDMQAGLPIIFRFWPSRCSSGVLCIGCCPERH